MATTSLPTDHQMDYTGLAWLVTDLVAAGKVFVGGTQISANSLGLVAGRVIESRTPTAAINTAGAGTYLAADILGGFIVRDPSGAGRTDTLDSAANLVAAVPNAAVGMIINVKVLNNADASETITLQAGSGGTFGATQKTHTIVQNASATLNIRFTNVTAASEAYVIYD